MFKFRSNLLMSLFRQCFCLVIAGTLLLGQLPGGACLFATSPVVKLHSAVFDASTAGYFIGEVGFDDSSDFLPAVVPEIPLSDAAELPLSFFAAPLLSFAAGVSSPPLARPPPVVFTC